MRNCLFISMLLLVFTVGCGKKHSADGNPILKLDKVNTTTLPPQGVVRFNFTFESKQIVDSIYVQKVVPDCTGSQFSAGYKVPDYPSSLEKGEIEVSFSNGPLPDGGPNDLRAPVCGEDDVATFRFVIKDVKNNVSDTITSPQITILLQ